MKIAVIADIHAHWIGLQAVVKHMETWDPDYVVVVGDHVNRGPRPRECLTFILDKAEHEGWLLVKGNHDEYVINQAGSSRPTSGPAVDFYLATIWTAEQLNNDVSALVAMPFQVSLTGPHGEELRFVHASMLGTRDGIFPDTTDDEIRKKIAPPPRVMGVGHTHRALIKQVDKTLLFNASSAGLPFDYDKRVGYAQLSWHRDGWQVEIIRLNYDYQAAEQDFYKTGYYFDGGPLVKLVLDEFHNADSRLAMWSYHYEEQIIAGKIGMAESVEQYLRELPRYLK